MKAQGLAGVIRGKTLRTTISDKAAPCPLDRVNSLYKAELIHRRAPWKSFEAVELATLSWVDWFNNRRLMEPIGNIPPAEAEARYYATLETMPVAA
jgi:putative transposase